MKETGIIMSGNHPKLILDGTKTMTRRTQGLKKINEYPDDWAVDLQGNIVAFRDIHTGEDVLIRCPYGQVGDRLWVRETFTKRPLPSGGEQILYKAQFNELVEMLDLNTFIEERGYPPLKPTWKPSIHMFRKDSRITLEITEVRVERVQEISEEDAKAEGAAYLMSYNLPEYIEGFRGDFKVLWDSLNAKRGYGWEVNPWCWCISFKLVDK